MSYLLKSHKDWKVYLLAFAIISIYPLINMYNNKFILQKNPSNETSMVSETQVLAEHSEDVISSQVIQQSNKVEAKSTATNSIIYIGISVNDYANKNGEISSLENKLGYKFSTVSIFKQFGHPSNKYLIFEDLTYIKQNGKTLLLAWEPWNPQEGISQSVDFLSQVPNGLQDAYIKEFSQQIKNYGSPVILRFGHEMNGNWYPWSLRPEEYKSAYRYVVDYFRREGVTNVKFMWSINAESVPYEPIGNVSKYYPGNDVVDLIGIDGFNWGKSNWRSFKEILTPSYNYLSQIYNKPIIISETASSEEGGDKAEWINEMFNSLQTNFPKVSEIIWFSILKEADWRIDSTDNSLKAFKDNL